MGTEPHITAQGEKMEATSMMLVAIAAKKGQIELRGEDSRTSGRASPTVVMTTSRRSSRRPVATGRESGSFHSGFALVTTGIRAKL